MRLKVYVAGPITNDDEELVKQNIYNGVDMGEKLFKMGFNAFVPFLSYWWNERYPHTWEEWLEDDFEWLHICDAMLVIPGPSKGREAEEKYAATHNIPVFYSIKDLEEWGKNKGLEPLNTNR